jgi:hypothetical protein
LGHGSHLRSGQFNLQLPITETVHPMGSDAVEGLSPPLKAGNNFHVSVGQRAH